MISQLLGSISVFVLLWGRESNIKFKKPVYRMLYGCFFISIISGICIYVYYEQDTYPFVINIPDGRFDDQSIEVIKLYRKDMAKQVKLNKKLSEMVDRFAHTTEQIETDMQRQMEYLDNFVIDQQKKLNREVKKRSRYGVMIYTYLRC
eukprot:TRINITY_DN2503_c0_g1_i3.p1 TRINITY_DN2503_c0_g1~~TRINITY_DN2503_c0_g1_i3.p1  ORF type:complete len:148 (-),score=14.88 TRINITY_DN2503_c0_g1_i3:309-752(-)